MSEKEITVPMSLLEDLPGWDESKMVLADKARTDIADAEVLLGALFTEVDKLADYELPGLTRMALKKLQDAYARIDMLHNELDVEREFGTEFGHDAQQLDLQQ